MGPPAMYGHVEGQEPLLTPTPFPLSRQVGKAAFLAHSLLSQGVQLDADVFTSLISACSLLGAWEPAQSLCAAAAAAQV